MLKCLRCNVKIDSNKSAFMIVLKAGDSSVIANMARTKDHDGGVVAIHVNGDRQCKKEVSGYRKMLLEALDIKEECDISFLDQM